MENVVYRCHLGLDIPGDRSGYGLRVGNETTAWKQGKLLAFCEAQRHSAWNRTDKKRLVVIVDVLRPEFISRER